MTKIVWLSVALFFIVSNVQVRGQQAVDHEKEALLQSKTIFVESRSEFVKNAEVENALRSQPEFKQWKLEIVSRRELADLVVEIQRTPFTTNFPFRVIDAVSLRVVMSGEVSSLFGTVSGRVARSMMKQMRKYRPVGNAAAKP